MSCKPMVVISYEYPISPEGAKHFLSQTDEWLREALAVPGAVEFRSYRNMEATSPLVIALVVYDSEEHAIAGKAAMAPIVRQMRMYGASNISVSIWGPSTGYPDPIKP